LHGSHDYPVARVFFALPQTSGVDAVRIRELGEGRFIVRRLLKGEDLKPCGFRVSKRQNAVFANQSAFPQISQ